MAEYIEREAVLDLLTNRDVVINPNDEVANIREDIECLPAADVRPVVLCRDCKYYKAGKYFHDIPFCFRLKGKDGEAVGYNFSPDDFCSRGEKREES